MERPSGPTRDYSDLIRRKCAWQASVPPAAAAEDPVVQSVIAAAPIAMGQTEAGPQTAVLEMGLPDPEARPAGHPLELLVDPLGGDKPGGAASQDMGAEECVAPRIPMLEPSSDPTGAPREAVNQSLPADPQAADESHGETMLEMTSAPIQVGAQCLAAPLHADRPIPDVPRGVRVGEMEHLMVVSPTDENHATEACTSRALVVRTLPCAVEQAAPGQPLRPVPTDEDAVDNCNYGMTPQEAVAYHKLKSFCSNIIKKLAPPLLKEVQATSLRPEAEPYTPRRNTRAAKKAIPNGATKATPAESVLLRTLGIVPGDLVVDDAVVEELQNLFDSPLREQHVRVIAALIGKSLPGMTENPRSVGIGAS